jgi:hypothetical protein
VSEEGGANIPRRDDPLEQAKAKAAATYDTAADHFDDEPLGFWKRIGERNTARRQCARCRLWDGSHSTAGRPNGDLSSRRLRQPILLSSAEFAAVSVPSSGIEVAA